MNVQNPYWITATQAVERHWVDALSKISQAVNAGASEREVGDLIARTSTLLAGVDRAAVAVSDLGGEGLRLVGAHGLTADYVERLMSDLPLHFRSDSDRPLGPSIRGFKSGRTVWVADINTDPAFEPWRQLAHAEGFRSLLAVPLMASGEAIGVLTCYCDDPGAIARSQSDLIESLAAHAGIVLESFSLRLRQEHSIEELSAALASLRRDHELHTTLVNLVLRGARTAEILEVAGNVLDLELHQEQGPPDEPDHGTQLNVAGEHMGWVMSDHPLSAEERRAVQSVGLVVTLELQRELSVAEAEARNRLDLLGDILSVSAQDDVAELLDRCRRHGHEFDTPHRVVVLGPDSPTTGGARRLARLAGHLAPSTRPAVLTSYRRQNAVLLVPSLPEYDDYLSRVHAAAQREFSGVSCSMVVGAECHHLIEYGAALRTAGAALELRQHSGSRGTLAHLDQLGTLQFLLQGPPEELIAFSRRMLDPLDGGSSRTSEAMTTLRTYLAQRQRAGATARALHVHPNTVTNRLERIGQLTGGSMDDADHLLNLKLALLVQDVISV